MNKKLRIIVAIVLCIAMVFALVACTGPKGDKGDPGTNGTNGTNGEDYQPPAAEPVKEFDYYDQTYSVGTDHVFKTMVPFDMRGLLQGYGSGASSIAGTEGKFAVLWGGAWDTYTVAMMQYINESAKAAGIETVWVMDTYWDGKIGETLDPIGNLTKANMLNISKETNISTSAETTNNLNAIINSFNTTLVYGVNPSVLCTGTVGTDPAQSAILMVIDVPKSGIARTNGAYAEGSNGSEGRRPSIMSCYVNTTVDNAGSYPNKYAAMKNEIDRVLADVGTEEGYYDAYVLRNYQTSLGNITMIPEGDPVATKNNKYIQSINYAELLALLATPGDHMIFFAAFGCGNAQALYRALYEEAYLADFQGTIYNFDMTLNASGSAAIGQGIRPGTNATRFLGALYGYLMDTYLNGLESLRNGGDSSVKDATSTAKVSHSNAIWNGNVTEKYITVGAKAYTRICLPAVMLYNNEVSSDLASVSTQGAAVSKGGIVDLHESELTTARVNGTDAHREKAFAHRSFELMFSKYGVAQELIANGYKVKSERNYVMPNSSIKPLNTTFVAAPNESGLAATANSGTKTESGYGLDVTLTATKGTETIKVIFNYFKTEAEITSITTGPSSGNVVILDVGPNSSGTKAPSGVQRAAIARYATDGSYAEAVLASLGYKGTMSGNAIYYGTKDASAVLDDFFGTERGKDPSDPVNGDGRYTEPSLNAVTYDSARKLSSITLPAGWAWLYPDTTPTVGGRYIAVYTPTDSSFATVTKFISLTVNPIQVAKPTVNGATSFVYNSTQQTLALNGINTDIMTVSGNTGTNAGDYKAVVALDSNYAWVGGGNVEFAWTITPIQVAKPTAGTSTFVYNGTEQTLAITGLTELMTVSNNKYTDAGNYKAVVTLKDAVNYAWVGGGNVEFAWTITPIQVAKPTAGPISLEYDGTEQTLAITGLTDLMNVEGNKETNAGNYTAIVTLKDTVNYAWIGGGDVEFAWTITPIQVAKPTLNGPDSLEYNGTEQTLAIDGLTALMKVEGNKETNAGNYTAVVTLIDAVNYAWIDGGDAEFEWEITPIEVVKPTVTAGSPETFVYDGTEKELALDDIDLTIMEVAGNKYTNAGNYTAIVTLKDAVNYVWADGGDAEFEWEITPIEVVKPVVSGSSTFAYDGTEQELVLTGIDTAVMEVEGNKGTNAGNYTAIVTLIDAVNYVWADGGDAEFEWEITPIEVVKPVVSGSSTFAYDGTEQELVLTGITAEMNVSGNKETNAGSYTAIVTLKDAVNYAWIGGGDAEFEWTITPIQVAKPVVSGSSTFAYSGTEQTLALTGIDTDLMNVSGNKATNAGSYTAIVTLKDTVNYAWVGGGVVEIAWTITAPSGPKAITAASIDADLVLTWVSENPYQTFEIIFQNQDGCAEYSVIVTNALSYDFSSNNDFSSTGRYIINIFVDGAPFEGFEIYHNYDPANP